MIFDYLKSKTGYILLLSMIAFTIPLPMLANNIAVILLLVYWLISYLLGQFKPTNPKDIIILMIPYAILVIGAINTSNMHQLTVELTKSLPFLLLPFIIYTIAHKIDIASFKIILKSFVLGNILVCLYLAGNILKTFYIASFSVKTLWGITHQSLGAHVDMNAIYLALYVALSLLIVIYYFLKKPYRKSVFTNLLYTLTTFLFVIILIFLSSRTVLFSILSILIVLFFLHFKQKSILKNSFFVLMGAGVLFLVTFTVNPVLKWRTASLLEIQDSKEIQGKEEGIKMRKKLWASSFEVLQENWLFGVGTGDFKDELEKVYLKNEYRIQYRMHMNSHNQYISYLVSNGIVGLLMFLIFLIYPIVIFYRKKRLFLLLTFLLFIMCFTTESYLYTNKGVILIAFFTAISLKHSNDLTNRHKVTLT